jgi:hypothetical protein
MLTQRKGPRRPSVTRSAAKDRELEKLLLLASQRLKPVRPVSAKVAAKRLVRESIKVA